MTRLIDEVNAQIDKIMESKEDEVDKKIKHYKKWAKKEGHMTYSASSVLGEYAKVHKLSKEDHEQMKRRLFPRR
jgi:hypothetical protein